MHGSYEALLRANIATAQAALDAANAAYFEYVDADNQVEGSVPLKEAAFRKRISYEAFYKRVTRNKHLYIFKGGRWYVPNSTLR